MQDVLNNFLTRNVTSFDAKEEAMFLTAKGDRL